MRAMEIGADCPLCRRKIAERLTPLYHIAFRKRAALSNTRVTESGQVDRGESTMADQFRDRNRSGVVALGTVVDGRPQLIVAVTEDLTTRGLHAGKLIKEIAEVVGGSGGGRPTMAQAGGKKADKLEQALARLSDLVEQALQ